MPAPVQAVVIGAGISGLVCAYRLQSAGIPVKLLEAATHAGGKFSTIERSGYILEGGPQSFTSTPAILELIRELGLESQLLAADPKAPRFVLKNKKLQAVPMSPPALLKSSLLGVGSRLKIVLEALRTSQPPDQEESVADFVRRKFGSQALDRLVAPFVSGIYAGDPEALSLQASFPTLYKWEKDHGSVLRAAMRARKSAKEAAESHAARQAGDKRSKDDKKPASPTLSSFRGGMKTFTDALRRKLGDQVLLGAEVTSVTRTASQTAQLTESAESALSAHRYEIAFDQGQSTQTLHAGAIVFATPALVSAQLLRAFSENLATTLEAIPYAPLAVVNLGYQRTQIGEALHGFGVLIPESENFRTLGTVFNSSLFPECAPPDCSLLTSFVGGATDPEIAGETDETIQRQVEDEMRRLFFTHGDPVVSQVWRYSHALPQYNIGHLERVRAIRQEISKLPGIFLAGNYLEGPSIAQCIDLAARRAESVVKFDPENPLEPR